MKKWNKSERIDFIKLVFKYFAVTLTVAFIIRFILMILRVEEKVILNYWRVITVLIVLSFYIYLVKKGFFRKYLRK